MGSNPTGATMLTKEKRLETYLRQVTGFKYVDGFARVTPKQRKRLQKKWQQQWRREFDAIKPRMESSETESKNE